MAGSLSPAGWQHLPILLPLLLYIFKHSYVYEMLAPTNGSQNSTLLGTYLCAFFKTPVRILAIIFLAPTLTAPVAKGECDSL